MEAAGYSVGGKLPACGPRGGRQPRITDALPDHAARNPWGKKGLDERIPTFWNALIDRSARLLHVPLAAADALERLLLACPAVREFCLALPQPFQAVIALSAYALPDGGENVMLRSIADILRESRTGLGHF
jgi:hypothetical protein